MFKLTIVIALASALATSPAAAKGEFQPSADAGTSGLHDDGLLWLRVWNTGSVGDISGGKGAGVYPAPHGPANLYRGELWFAAQRNGKLSVVSSPREWHGLTPVIMSNEPEWSRVPPYIKQEGTLDSYYRMDDADSGESGPLGVECDVHTISWSTENQDDFIGFRYYLHNNNSTALENTYLAFAYDFDVGGSLSYIDDKVGFDAQRSMPYMYDDDDEHPYVGILPINAAVRGAHAWDIMNDPDNEWLKYYYMTEPGFDCERTQPYDWRVLVSFGPVTIPPLSRHTLTCALVAGMTLAELYANADTALAGEESGPEPVRPTSYAFNLGRNYPNPVSTETRIAFTCPVSARVKLAVYDLAGRRVATLTDEIYQPGSYDVTWKPEAAAPGVYLYALEATGERLVKTMVVAR
ncbi:MAG TPA: T9SS type A sorting domain-containing protein [bacterium]|nr:T9SS type A sorting domain-containing protein [bacterium]